MRNKLLLFFFLLSAVTVFSQQVNIVDIQGGEHAATMPLIIDNDNDGLADKLEQLLLNKFVPKFISIDDYCPFPGLDSNSIDSASVVVCRIYPVFQQYIDELEINELNNVPAALVTEKKLNTGLIWVNNHIIIRGALLYGRDCGLNGHVADVESFTVTLKYTGNDETGWRHDTVMGNWIGDKIQTISHASTFCEKKETFNYRSTTFPNGKDTIYCSPDKHGNYLTIGKCNSSFICDNPCVGPRTLKKVNIVNAGEYTNPLVSDLGNYYSGYTGEDPWSDTKFIATQGGDAGTIKSKLVQEITFEMLNYRVLSHCDSICNVYNEFYACGNGPFANCTLGCNTLQADSAGKYIPDYDCTTTAIQVYSIKNDFKISNNNENILISSQTKTNYIVDLYDINGKRIYTANAISNHSFNTSTLSSGVYVLSICNERGCLKEKVVITN